MSREPIALSTDRPALNAHPGEGLTRSQFPSIPPGWFLFAPLTELQRGPVEKTLGGVAFVAFVDEQGAPAVLDARCPHMGAHLARGKVEGGSLQCPYHGWTFDRDGQCTSVPRCSGPHAARIRAWPFAVRHGCLFVFNRKEALFPLPRFDQEKDVEGSSGLVASRPFSFDATCDWVTFASHAFDIAHFSTVHERELLAPPTITEEAPYVRRNAYDARVTGTSLREHLLRLFGGATVSMTITAVGANLFMLEGRFARARTCFLISANPVGADRCEATGIVLARRSVVPGLTRILLAVKRLFTRGYLAEEALDLGDTQLRFERTTPADGPVLDYFHWLAELPGFTREARSLDLAPDDAP